MPEIRVSKDSWYRAVETVREFANDPDVPVWICLAEYYQLCIPSVVTRESLILWRLYHDLDGFSRESYESYMRLPARIVDAFSTIKGEIDRIERIRKTAPAAPPNSEVRRG